MNEWMNETKVFNKVKNKNLLSYLNFWTCYEKQTCFLFWPYTELGKKGIIGSYNVTSIWYPIYFKQVKRMWAFLSLAATSIYDFGRRTSPPPHPPPTPTTFTLTLLTCCAGPSSYWWCIRTDGCTPCCITIHA